MDKNCLAFIPARGGSKRLKNKNTLIFDGKPLIYHTIISAIKSELFRKIVVSTDSPGTANISKQLGVEIIERPDDISSDYSTTAEAAQHALQYYQEIGENFDAIATLQPTNPLRPPELIKNCASQFFQAKNIDSLVTVSANKKKIGSAINNRYTPLNYSLGQRSQDVSKQYFENGLLYISKPALVLENQDLFGKEIFPYIVDHWAGQIDIDDQLDFEMAEFLYKKHKQDFFS